MSHEGRRIAAYAKTKEGARQKLRAMQRKQDQGLPLVTSTMPLRDYLEQWLASIRNRVRPSTYDRYEVIVRVHILPELGHIKLGKLSPDDINKAWEAMRSKGKSASTIRHCHLRLGKALNDAVKRQLIFRNSCQAVTPPRSQAKEMHPPDASAIHRLLETARATEYFEVFYTAFHTGLRRGELLALRWRDVDLDMATISVNRGVYQAKGGQSIFNPPKTSKGRRLVSLTPSSALVLRSLCERHHADGLMFGYAVNEDSPVFRYRHGAPMLPRGVSDAFKKIANRAGLEGHSFHSTRHAHATLMLRQGIHPRVVQERLGHQKVQTTLDIYSHVAPDLAATAALRFEEGLNATRTPAHNQAPVSV